MMGGLIDGSTVKGDLWMIESSGGSLSCFQIATVSEGPGPRVGHASLLVGNAFIVFGGDTKIDESDALDDTLYLLNTCMLLDGGIFPYFQVFFLSDMISSSVSPMVARYSPRFSTGRTIRSLFEHSRLEALRIRRPGRGLFFQRFDSVRLESAPKPWQQMGATGPEQS